MPPFLALSLGPLERRVLRLVWRLKSATVRDLLDTGELSGAYTTLMTTLDRLHKKGILTREAEGRAFRYFPAQSEADFNGAFIRSAMQQILGSTSALNVSQLVDAISDHDRGLLDELEREIERKRRDLDRNAKG